MQKPQDLKALKDLIKGMAHRERFVFNTIYQDQLEIYATQGLKTFGTNICLTGVYSCGAPKQTKNKLLHTWLDKDWQNLFDLLA